MINLYSGTPGSGKSLHMASEIRKRLKYFKDSVTLGNFYVNVKAVDKRIGDYIMIDNSRLTPERLIKFSRRLAKHKGRRLREDEIVLYIDEAQLLFNSRGYNSKERMSWLSFFSQHRHFGYKIILIAQFDRMLDRQIRSLIEYETIHRKVSRAGKIGAVIGFIMRGNLFVSIDVWYPLKEQVGSNFFMGGSKLYAIYDSYNDFKGFA